VFYIIIFSALAVLLVIAGLTVTRRRRGQWEQDESHDVAHNTPKTTKARRQTKAQRAQSRHDRRHRH
jgi:hypothetical protein